MENFIGCYICVGFTGCFIVAMTKESGSAAVTWLVAWPVVLIKIALRGLREF